MVPDDEPSDRMDDQFELFRSTVNSHWFARSKFIIVFTKTDLLEEYLKIKNVANHVRRNGISTVVVEYLGHLEM